LPEEDWRTDAVERKKRNVDGASDQSRKAVGMERPGKNAEKNVGEQKDECYGDARAHA